VGDQHDAEPDQNADQHRGHRQDAAFALRNVVVGERTCADAGEQDQHWEDAAEQCGRQEPGHGGKAVGGVDGDEDGLRQDLRNWREDLAEDGSDTAARGRWLRLGRAGAVGSAGGHEIPLVTCGWLSAVRAVGWRSRTGRRVAKAAATLRNHAISPS
jgi:hypothetical protein